MLEGIDQILKLFLEVGIDRAGLNSAIGEDGVLKIGRVDGGDEELLVPVANSRYWPT